MKIEHVFTVAQSSAAVWEFFQDIGAVADCMPGAELTEQKPEGGYRGRLTARLGPMTTSFEGDAVINADSAAKTAVILAKGVDRQGGSRGEAEVVYRLEASGTSTKVDVTADVKLSGAVAQFGRTGLINEMSNRLIGDFVTCLEQKLNASDAEQAATFQAGEVRGLSLFFSALWSSLKRALDRLLRP